MGVFTRAQQAKAMAALASAITAQSTTRNPFGWVPDAPVLVLAAGISGPQLALSVDGKDFVMHYIFDRDRGPAEKLTLAPTTEPLAAIARIRPLLRSLSARVLTGGDVNAHRQLDNLVDHLGWSFHDTSEVVPRLDAVIDLHWGHGKRPPANPDDLLPYIREAASWGLWQHQAMLTTIRGFSFEFAARDSAVDFAWQSFDAARDCFQEAMDILERAGQESSKLYQLAQHEHKIVSAELDRFE